MQPPGPVLVVEFCDGVQPGDDRAWSLFGQFWPGEKPAAPQQNRCGTATAILRRHHHRRRPLKRRPGPNAAAPSMPPAPPPNRPQTIKQAKAAYKSRGQPSLTEKEKRQLDRAVELDRRAWRAKEADKRKAEAAKKRLEKERQQKEELEKVRQGSQRRCDRFGYKSSQMHLGAFLNKRSVRLEDQKENLQDTCVESEGESFEDDDLDDDTLLDAMAQTDEVTTRTTNTPPPQTTAECAHIGIRPSKTASVNCKIADTSTHEIEDFDSFWEDLDSSTQIARDLASEESTNAGSKPTSKASSFSSGDFDLTVEDMEQLDPPPPTVSKLEQDRKLMPPPPVPITHPPPTEEFTMSQLE